MLKFLAAHQLDAMQALSGICGAMAFLLVITKALTKKRRLVPTFFMIPESMGGKALIFLACAVCVTVGGWLLKFCCQLLNSVCAKCRKANVE